MKQRGRDELTDREAIPGIDQDASQRETLLTRVVSHGLALPVAGLGLARADVPERQGFDPTHAVPPVMAGGIEW
ncbi:hypothetical protein GCM10027059_49920 [Myceligenerans halotolerans]